MSKKLLIPLGALLFLGGCATVKHDCDLGEECVGTSDVYTAAVANEGSSESVMEGVEPASEAEEAPIEQWRPYSGGGLTAQPVYQPGKPVRIWVAPWRGNDGILRSGEYLYVTLPDAWRYGELREKGVGADMIGPAQGELHIAPAGRGRQPNPNRIQPQMQIVQED